MLNSSVLILDPRVPINNELGADVATSSSDAVQKASTHPYSSIVLDLKLTTQNEALELIELAKKQNEDCQIIFLDDPLINNQITVLSNRFSIFKILPQFEQDKLFRTIQESLEEYNLKQQNKELWQILKEQNEKLHALTLDLEHRVQLRQKNILESKEKLLQTNKHITSIHTALVAIQKTDSIADMEKALVKCLSDSLHITWVRILFQTQNSLTQDSKHQLQQYAIFEGDLVLEKRSLGKIIFARNQNQKHSDSKFTKEETQLLKQISDAISLALDRLIQREKSDFVRQQWQSTFDAIVEPVTIINAQYELLQHNQAFSDQVALSHIKKKYCYQQLFDRDQPCENCHLGKKFDLEMTENSKNQEVLFEVESQGIKTHKNIFVNFYRDKLKQVRNERQILESSKMAELGLVGGSIAHELNNPLAGLITFIQILKQDVEKENSPKNATLLIDLQEMEKSALRCKDIIHNLLSFTRKSDDKKVKVHLMDLVNKSLRVIQLQAKPFGVEIKVTSKIENDIFDALENPLTQSLVNILQNAFEAIVEKRKTDKTFSPLIEVEISQDAKSNFVDVIDNGVGLGKNEQLKVFTPFFSTKNSDQHRGLGLTVSYQIVKEHSGDIELTHVSQNRVRVRVIFPRPVFDS